jgi:hypothetical protein
MHVRRDSSRCKLQAWSGEAPMNSIAAPYAMKKLNAHYIYACCNHQVTNIILYDCNEGVLLN